MAHQVQQVTIASAPHRFGLVVKRLLDIALAGLALVLFAPVMALIAIAIKLDSSGPILFRQVRIGLRGRPFTMYKFRTMIPGAEKGRLTVLTSDPRLTRVGYWLRSFSLDELPQLVNVLKGEMSLIGPRPLLPEQAEKFTAEERKRLHALPGMTNLSALKGRNSLPWEERMKWDVWYVEHWSLWLDLQIFLKSLWLVLRCEGAYASPEAAAAAARRQVDQSANYAQSNHPSNSNHVRPMDSTLFSLVLHHIGVVVQSVDSGWNLYSALGFQAATPIYTDPVQRVRVQFFKIGPDVSIELVEPTEPDSPVSNFLKKRGSGLHHLCYLVDDINHVCECVREQGGIVTCEPVPAVAFQGRRIAFVYWHGSLIEFLERGEESQ